MPLAPRFAKYYKTENGSEYRTLLKAFGIRFDVLVYGNVSPCAGRTGRADRGGTPDQSLALKRPSAGHTSRLLTWLLTCAVKGRGLLLHPSRSTVRLAGSPSSTPGHLPCGTPAHSLRSLFIQAGKFNIIPTIISSVAAFTSVGVVSSAPPGSDPRPVRDGPRW